MKKVAKLISLSTLASLLISFFLADIGRIVASALLAIICALTVIFIKKRGIPSFVYSKIAMLMAVIAAVYVMLYYLAGLQLGFAKAIYGAVPKVISGYILPIAAIIVFSELLRNIMRSQENKPADVLSYFSCVVAEVLIHYALVDILSFKKFMDIMAIVFLPAVLSNLLYHYLAKRYGVLPNIVYRLIITLYPYVISYKTGIPDSLLAFINLILPLLIYVFIDYLYEKKKRYALSGNYKAGVALTVVLVAIMASAVMLVSNSFRFGACVIATDSMTGGTRAILPYTSNTATSK